MISDIKPGCIIEVDGHPHLVEAVRLEVIAQRIEPLMPLLERNEKRDYEDREYPNPVFIHLQGDITDPQFQSPKLKILFPEGEAE